MGGRSTGPTAARAELRHETRGQFDSREFLVYNPNDTHAMASHDAFLLQRTAAALVNYPGYYSARPLDRPHWALLSYD